jgi:hypothetical protein
MNTEAEIRALVERYRVCWDTFPEWSQTNHERHQTGVVVELYGTHDRPSAPPTAGCKNCIPVLQAVLKIAEVVVRELREPIVSIRAHSGIEYATERGGRPDIVVALTLSAPDGKMGPELERALATVRKSLTTLGASKRAWRKETPA